MVTSSNRSTLVGSFQSRDQAESAVDALERAGFPADEIGFLTRDPSAVDAPETRTADDAGAKATAGLVTGGTVGGILGAAAALLSPGLGPVVAGGILATTLAGAGIGAMAGGLLGALASLGVSEEEARHYEGEYRAGRSLVTVRTEGRYEEALEILHRHGASDVATRDRADAELGPAASDPT